MQTYYNNHHINYLPGKYTLRNRFFKSNFPNTSQNTSQRLPSFLAKTRISAQTTVPAFHTETDIGSSLPFSCFRSFTWPMRCVASHTQLVIPKTPSSVSWRESPKDISVSNIAILSSHGHRIRQVLHQMLRVRF